MRVSGSLIVALSIVLAGELMNADVAQEALEWLRQVAIRAGCDPAQARGSIRHDATARTWELHVRCEAPEPVTWEPEPRP